MDKIGLRDQCEYLNCLNLAKQRIMIINHKVFYTFVCDSCLEAMQRFEMKIFDMEQE